MDDGLSWLVVVALNSPPSIVGYLYPWDTGERLDRVLDTIRPDRVALAGLYHSVRATSFADGNARVVDAWHGATYLGREAWSGQCIQPSAPTGWACEDAFGKARAWLRSRGLETDAWLVLSHLEGIIAPGHFVVNAVGEELPHTLCAGRPAFKEHAIAALTAALTGGASDGIVLEAVASLGASHPVSHDKTNALGRSHERQTFASWCFCLSCAGRRGYEDGRLRRTVSDVIDGRLEARSQEARAAALALSADRTAMLRMLLSGLAIHARSLGCKRVAAFVTADEESFSPSLPASALEFGSVDVAVVSAWGDPRKAAAELAALRSNSGIQQIGAYVSVLADGSATLRCQDIKEWSLDEIHLYHLGLASDDNLALWASY